MKYYSNESVWDAAIRRINWLFDEFENVVIGYSGGKDSTVCLQLTLMVAEQRGRLPVPVVFLDQEAEWGCVIDHIREVMSDPRVRPIWLQIPLRLFNATSTEEEWLHCWEEGKEWIRPKEPNSIHVNDFGTETFAELLNGWALREFDGQKCVTIAGVRAEESPARMKGLTTYETYRGETWGKKIDAAKGHVVMYPLYDWSYTDIWKAIHDNRWPYCKLYDYMYQHGVPVAQMRVSNVHHESAVRSLFYLQEIEGDTWNRIVARLSGINTVGQMKEQFMRPKKLPPGFKDWREYRDYLIEHLAPEDKQEYYRKIFAAYDRRYVDPRVLIELAKTQCAVVLSNDYHETKLKVFVASHGAFSIAAGTKGGIMAKSRRDKVDAE